MKKILAKAAELCNNNEIFSLATILESAGSVPRGAGSKMLVDASGRITGTVGGGAIEARIIEKSLECLNNGESRIERFNLTKEISGGIDMTCGGSVEVLIQGIDGKKKEIALLFNQADGDYLITEICRTDGKVSTTLSLSPERGGEELKEQLKKAPSYLRTKEREGRFFLAEAIRRKHCVYICGGGHVGQKTAQLADFAGFDTIVIDDRLEFADPERFPTTSKVLHYEEYADCFSAMEEGIHYYIVIMTRGHRYDRDVLEQALKKETPYIGMIGSRKKISHLFDSLREKGFSQPDLDRVTTPIGLPINSETPEEIAVSVLAQLIEVKNRG
jgi:xanthine dehydrogenase accessory factor